MEYRYSEHYTMSVSVRLTVHEVGLLLTLSRNLMADTDEALAARTVAGWERWDARAMRDSAQTVLESVAEAMKYEAQALEAKSKG